MHEEKIEEEMHEERIAQSERNISYGNSRCDQLEWHICDFIGAAILKIV